jgi:hypothetical protein
MQPESVDDAASLADLALRLKPTRGPAPKREMVQAALALARNPRLSAVAVAPKGGHDRAKKLSQRIIELGVLPPVVPLTAVAAEVENEENAVPSAAAAATAAAGAEADRKRKHAEAQARYQARQKACEARAAHLRDWDHLTEAEQAAAGCFGFTNSELWQARLEQSAHSRDVEGGAIDLQADKWLLPWCSLSSDDRSAARALGYSSESWEWQMLGKQRLRWSEVVFVSHGSGTGRAERHHVRPAEAAFRAHL